MERIHPASLENYNYTKSEKKMYDKLKEQLTKDKNYHVFFSVNWVETIRQVKTTTRQSECDFLIFNPAMGFITIEVKGGENIRVNDRKWTIIENRGEERTLNKSPYDQAKDSMYYFKKYFEEESSQKFKGVFGFAVAFPNFVVSQQLATNAPKELTIDCNDMDSLDVKIDQIFQYWKNNRKINNPFTSDQRQTFLSAINKRISMSAAAGTLIEIKEKELAKINLVQDSILNFLQNYPKARIVGGAGTGKTFIGIKKAMRDDAIGKHTLFTCCNGELAAFVKAKLNRSSKIEVLTYDELMKSPPKEKFDSIIVDEAQDFATQKASYVRNLLKDEKNSTLYVLYDKDQDLSESYSDDPFQIKTPPYVLKYNIRNTGEIYQFAVKESKLGHDTIANNIEGAKPQELNFRQKTLAVNKVAEIVKNLVNKENVKTNSIVIVSNISYEESVLAGMKHIANFELVTNAHYLNVKDNQISFKTTEEFKGQEANVVVYLKHESPNYTPTNLDKVKDYVAITRAKYYLYKLNIKNWR